MSDNVGHNNIAGFIKCHVKYHHECWPWIYYAVLKFSYPYTTCTLCDFMSFCVGYYINIYIIVSDAQIICRTFLKRYFRELFNFVIVYNQ